MAHSLLWLESLVTALLWIGATYTMVARLRGFSRYALRLAGIGLPLLVGIGLVTASSLLIAQANVTTHYLPWTVSWLIGVGIGGFLIRRRALRNVTTPASTTVTLESVSAHPAAHGWSPAFAVASFGAAFGLTMITFWTIDAQVRSQLALLRAESSALALAVAPERVPDAENAALVYEDAMAAVVSWDEDQELSDRFYAWTDREQTTLESIAGDAELDTFLRAQQPALELLRRAAAIPYCYHERGYAHPDVDLVLPDVLETIELSKLLALDTRYRVATGDAGRAVENVITLRRFSAHVGQDPVLISLLVSIAIRQQVFHVLGEVLAMESLTDEQLARLADMPRVSSRRALQRAAQMEEAFGIGVLADVGSGRVQSPAELVYMVSNDDPNSWWQRTAWSMATPLWRVFLLPDDLRGYRSLMGAHRTAAAYPTWSESGRREVEQLTKLEEKLIAAPPGVMTAILVPALSNLHRSTASLDAMDRLERMAIALVTWRRANPGQQPETLDVVCNERVPAVPRDPHSGNSLRFAVRPDGTTVLYSVGDDGIDNGGTSAPPGEWQAEGTDLVLALKTD